MPYRFHAVIFAVFAVVLSTSSVLAAGAPSEMEVKTLIEKIDLGADKDFKFHSIQVSAPRKASLGEISAVGMPPNSIVVPVKVSYTEDTGGGWVRDHVQNYYFFKDDFGAWTVQANATSGNSTSEPHR